LLEWHGSSGLRLSDLEKASGLKRPTVHRILGVLIQHGLVEQEFETRKYRLRPECSFFNPNLDRRTAELRQYCQSGLRELAKETGDTALLMIQSGTSAVCVDRLTGRYPHKPLTVEIGTRRPLGIGAGGIVLLSAMNPREADALVASLRNRITKYPNSSIRSISLAVHAARANGYAFSDGYVRSNVRALAVPVRDSAGETIAALCLAAIFDRIKPGAIGRLVETLIRHRTTIERTIRQAEKAQSLKRPLPIGKVSKAA
jgi:DNA-binding IclR family transcriptional regulator